MSSSSASASGFAAEVLARSPVQRASSSCLRVEQLQAAQAVDRAALGGGHQPRAGDCPARRFGARSQRGDQRVLRQFLGQVQVAHACASGRRSRRADSMRQTASIARWVDRRWG
jgi:hypothetical protein